MPVGTSASRSVRRYIVEKPQNVSTCLFATAYESSDAFYVPLPKATVQVPTVRIAIPHNPDRWSRSTLDWVPMDDDGRIIAKELHHLLDGPVCHSWIHLLLM